MEIRHPCGRRLRSLWTSCPLRPGKTSRKGRAGAVLFWEEALEDDILLMLALEAWVSGSVGLRLGLETLIKRVRAAFKSSMRLPSMSIVSHRCSLLNVPKDSRPLSSSAFPSASSRSTGSISSVSSTFTSSSAPFWPSSFSDFLTLRPERKSPTAGSESGVGAAPWPPPRRRARAAVRSALSVRLPGQRPSLPA